MGAVKSWQRNLKGCKKASWSWHSESTLMGRGLESCSRGGGLHTAQVSVVQVSTAL